jgi:hypothetical protein
MKSDESMNLTHLAPPPPYSTVAELQPQMKWQNSTYLKSNKNS